MALPSVSKCLKRCLKRKLASGRQLFQKSAFAVVTDTWPYLSVVNDWKVMLESKWECPWQTWIANREPAFHRWLEPVLLWHSRLRDRQELIFQKKIQPRENLTEVVIFGDMIAQPKKHFCCHRNSRLQMFFKIGALKKFAIFTGKNLCMSLLILMSLFLSTTLQLCNFIKKRLQHRCFPVNPAKFLREVFL